MLYKGSNSKILNRLNALKENEINLHSTNLIMKLEGELRKRGICSYFLCSKLILLCLVILKMILQSIFQVINLINIRILNKLSKEHGK